MSANKTLIIIGCGGHARSIADVALFNGYKKLVFVDENARENETILGFYVKNDFTLLETSNQFIIGIGDNNKRETTFATYVSGIKLISNDAYIGAQVSIDEGVFVGHNAYIGPLTCIGRNTIINTHAIVEHECIIGKHSHISINSTIAGRCKIGDNVFIGAGAIVKDGIEICSHVTIGSGSVVINDIAKSGVYVGIPAKKIK